MKHKHLFRIMGLLALLISLVPLNNAGALAASAAPPADMFQLPWELGKAWVALDGLDNGNRRPASSSHNYKLGGAIDFAPRPKMVTGENTSDFWVTAAAAGTVIGKSSCYVTLAHASGWITQYHFLGNIQVQLGDVVERNQRLGILADGVRYKYCPGYEEINVPHVHFVMRPSIVGATLAGWEVTYTSLLNRTFFRKGLTFVGLFKPLMNEMDVPGTPTPTAMPTDTQTAFPSPTPVLTVPYVSTIMNLAGIHVGETTPATVTMANLPADGYASAEFTCTYNATLAGVSNITVANLFGADPVAAITEPQNGSFIVAIAGSNGSKATTNGIAFTFNLEGLQEGQTAIDCRARVSRGDNVLTTIEFVPASLTVLGDTPTVTTTPGESPTPVESPSPSVSETPTSPPVEPPTLTFTPTSTATPAADWLSFINSPYGFLFQYPSGGVLLAGNTDSYARINLPFVLGTNLKEKYLEVIVAENANPCRSPLATGSMLETSETVIINGIYFLKETGQDGGAGNLHQWIAYSTSRDNVCVSLDFVLHSLNPDNFPTPSAVFDYRAESAVFGQIVGTYRWFTPGYPPTPTTSTPAETSTPVESPTATQTVTVTPTVMPTQSAGGVLSGQVIAYKPVSINVFNAGDIVVGSGTANEDGTFTLNSAAGANTVIASASGYLNAQASVTITLGSTTTLPTISLLAGDIDGNNVIDQFDAMTIGMGYNTANPPAADLNNDGTINVLDLELLAANYRKTGPTDWE
jgi:murein DD-endopeptidase MepM/ murein hydrolase activator NlpD